MSIEELIRRLNEYFNSGGLFNPELMDHDKVHELLYDCREKLLELSKKPK